MAREWRLPRDTRAEVRVPYVLRSSFPTAFTVPQIETLSRCGHDDVVSVLKVLIAEGSVEVIGAKLRWVPSETGGRATHVM